MIRPGDDGQTKESSTSDDQVELENQFIMRLPLDIARSLREALKNGALNLKDRLSISLDPDMRHGEVRFDHWVLHAKLYDLPTILETHKTIDTKSFYKTADICQVLVCKEEDDKTDEESPTNKVKKKDSIKVDKKYLWPHGITPPMKNVRRRRFRKTLRKKYVEAPEVEKEVKRLLKVDSEAIHVKWEIIVEEEEGSNKNGNVEASGVVSKMMTGNENSTQHSFDVGENDIFGDVSDSEEEKAIDAGDIDDNSLSGEDSRSRMSDFGMRPTRQQESDHELVTQFCREMFMPKTEEEALVMQSPQNTETVTTRISRGDMLEHLGMLQQELSELRVKKQQQEAELAGIENHALRLRLQEILQNLELMQEEKEKEYKELLSLLSEMDM